MSRQPSHSFSNYQKFVIGILAFLQFTIVLDFMIMSPLGAILMPALQITPAQFGFVVSVYAFSAGLSGILAAGFADRFDRKKLLLFFYSGFILGTLFCGIAPSYPFLLIARMVTGLFGGVIGSIVLAITTDLFPLSMRGRVMGILQTAFAASQILGIPAGLFFSNHWGWHAPFLMIVFISLLAGLLIWLRLRPVDAHLHLKTKPDRNPLHHLWITLRTPQYLLGFAVTALLSIGGFMLMPFGSAFTVNNLNIAVEKLPLMYLITGICTILVGPMIGKAADAYGKYNVYLFGAALTVIMVTYYTHMGPSSLAHIITVNAILFVGIFSRIIPSQALTSAIPSPENRGAYMAISSSLQQVAGGIASVLAGWIVVQASDNAPIEHFDTVGYIVAGTTVFTTFLMYFVHLRTKRASRS